jgi:hypothetical protein
MDYDTQGTLYATCERSDGSDTHVLITIDPCTGAGTEVGPTGVEMLGFGDTMSDISFRNSDGALYAYLEASDGVGTVDPLTGAATALGPSNSGSCCGNGIAFSPGDVLYHATDDPFNQINQTTGRATFVANLSFPAWTSSQGRVFCLHHSMMDGHPSMRTISRLLTQQQATSPSLAPQ